MKLNLLLCLILLFSFGQLYPQQFYLKALGGYGIGTAPDVMTATHQTYTNNVSSYSLNSENYSFGKGIEAALAAGYYLNSIVSVELEFGYHKSATVSYESSYLSDQSDETYYNELTANSFNIIPAIVFHTEISIVKPFLKIGPIISFSGIDNTYNLLFKSLADNTTQNRHILYEYRGGIAFGVSSSAGVEYNLGSGINIMFEVNNKSISYSPKDGEITEYTINGISSLENLSASQKKFSFKDNVSVNGQQSSNDRTKEQYPFSSLSFLLGVAVEL